MAECFSKYDCLNFDGHKTEATVDDGHDTEATIHDGLEDALVEDPNMEGRSLMDDNEGSNLEKEEINDPFETRGNTMNIKDPGGIEHEILLRKAGTPLYEGSSLNRLTLTLTLLVCCTTFHRT